MPGQEPSGPRLPGRDVHAVDQVQADTAWHHQAQLPGHLRLRTAQTHRVLSEYGTLRPRIRRRRNRTASSSTALAASRWWWLWISHSARQLPSSCGPPAAARELPRNRAGPVTTGKRRWRARCSTRTSDSAKTNDSVRTCSSIKTSRSVRTNGPANTSQQTSKTASTRRGQQSSRGGG